MKPVVIVGAGLAGLACARTLRRHRVPFHLIEASDRIGGRLKTDLVEGCPLDQGYQVYFTAYPHAKFELDENKLDLKMFEPGAVVVWDGDQHLISREQPLQTALSKLLPTSDKLRLARWTSDVQWLDQDDMDEVADRPIEQYLRDEGFSNAAIDRFFRPFLGGIFLDRSLSGSCRQLLFVWRYLNEGHTAVPNLGMEEIPKQIGITIGQDVRLNTRVTGLNRNGAVRGLKLDDGTALEAEAIVLACDAENAAALSGIPMQTEFRHSITLYFLAPEKPTRHGGLVLNGNMKGIANHLAVMPNSPSGRFVLSATILGERPETNEQLAEIVKAELRLWFPNRDPEAWAFLRGYRCRNSQLVQAPGFQSARPGYDTGTPGLYFAGEFTTNSSIDGATQSGIECAEHLLRGLGVLAS